jgi:hypothetical protein
MFTENLRFFWTNIATTMAYPNFKNGPKNGLCPLGVKLVSKLLPNCLSLLVRC